MREDLKAAITSIYHEVMENTLESNGENFTEHPKKDITTTKGKNSYL